MDRQEALGWIPDPAEMSFAELERWLAASIDQSCAIDVQDAQGDAFTSFQMEPLPDYACGPEADPMWRRYFLAILLADWASYERPVDRIDYARLKYILTSAYPWFRLYFVRTKNALVPVGYAAWYPLSRFVFDATKEGEAEIDDRGAFLPLRTARKGDKYDHVYILNVSIIKNLRNTPCAVRMLLDLHRDAMAQEQAGLMAITVDEAGSRFSCFVGMDLVSRIKVQGEMENLYVRLPRSLLDLVPSEG